MVVAGPASPTRGRQPILMLGLLSVGSLALFGVGLAEIGSSQETATPLKLPPSDRLPRRTESVALITSPPSGRLPQRMALSEHKSPVVIGIAGGSGSGKTTRRQWLALGQLAVYVCRLGLRINKYVLWLGFALLVFHAPSDSPVQAIAELRVQSTAALPSLVGLYRWGPVLQLATRISGSIFMAACLLELTCWRTVGDIVSRPGGGRLYSTAWLFSLVNQLVVAPCVFLLTTLSFPPASTSPTLPRALWSHALMVAAAVFIHSVGYYLAHRAMHTYQALWWMHRFHHQFNTHVTPITTAAVNPAEYLLAYLLPFVAAAALLQNLAAPGVVSAAALIIGHSGNLAHTPWLEGLSRRCVPRWFVSTAHHLEHHRSKSGRYSEMPFNMDTVVSCGLACVWRARREEAKQA